eukprot:ANDGO_08210.mRNA.1 Cell division control protein 2 homolog 3
MNSEFRQQIIERERSRIDQYEIIQPLGHGTYGQVSLVRHKPTEQVFALKEFFKKPKAQAKPDSQDEKEKESSPIWEGIPRSATREFAFLLQLNHPNIVRVYDFMLVPDTGSAYLVMEKAMTDLTNLFDTKKTTYLKNVTLELKTVKRMMYQILSGVQYLHSLGIFHRDLKPGNILFCSESQDVVRTLNTRMDCIKITDFGLARQYFQPLHPLHCDGIVVSLYWRAPELLLGAKHYGPAVDMWAVGCIFAQFFRGGRLLFVASHKDNIDQLHIDQLHRIFLILGKPTSQQWPEMEHLQNYRAALGEANALPPFPALSHDRLLNELRGGGGAGGGQVEVAMNTQQLETTRNFLSQFLQINPAQRITAEAALRHPFFADILFPAS